MKTGMFISIEGIDGSGKSTTMSKTVSLLQSRGLDAAPLSRKDTKIYSPAYLSGFMKGLKMSIWEAKPDDPVSLVPEEVWLYLHASWYRMMRDYGINPKLENGQIVVVDGWYYKFLARHLANGNFDFSMSYRILQDLGHGDLVFFLDIPSEICWERRKKYRASELGAHAGMKTGSARDRFITYQEVVRKHFLEFSKAPNWQIIPVGNKNQDELVEEIVDIIHNRIKTT